MPILARPSRPLRSRPPWRVRALATGLGNLENSLPDGAGVLVTDLRGGRVLRVTADGAHTVVATGLPAAGGLARHGEHVYVTTGNAAPSALRGRADGTINRLDPRTGENEVWARGLVMPNGLALLPDGSAVTTRVLGGVGGVRSRVTRVTGAAAPDLTWCDLTGTNGAAVSGDVLYVTRSLWKRAEIWRVPVDDPASRTLVADLGPALAYFLDDLTVTPDGLYVAAPLAGAVLHVDPATGTGTVLAAGLHRVTSVAAIAPGTLWVTSLEGTLYELTRP